MTRDRDLRAAIGAIVIAVTVAVIVVLIGYGIAWLPSPNEGQCVTMTTLEKS